MIKYSTISLRAILRILKVSLVSIRKLEMKVNICPQLHMDFVQMSKNSLSEVICNIGVEINFMFKP